MIYQKQINGFWEDIDYNEYAWLFKENKIKVRAVVIYQNN